MLFPTFLRRGTLKIIGLVCMLITAFLKKKMLINLFFFNPRTPLGRRMNRICPNMFFGRGRGRSAQTGSLFLADCNHRTLWWAAMLSHMQNSPIGLMKPAKKYTHAKVFTSRPDSHTHSEDDHICPIFESNQGWHRSTNCGIWPVTSARYRAVSHRAAPRGCLSHPFEFALCFSHLDYYNLLLAAWKSPEGSTLHRCFVHINYNQLALSRSVPKWCGSQTNDAASHTPALLLLNDLWDPYIFCFKRKGNGVYPAGHWGCGMNRDPPSRCV